MAGIVLKVFIRVTFFNSLLSPLFFILLHIGFSPPSIKSKVKVKVAPRSPTLCDTVDCSLPGSIVHGILQARILEWAAIPFSRGSSQPKDRTQVSSIAGRFFTSLATREAHKLSYIQTKATKQDCMNLASRQQVVVECSAASFQFGP